MTTLNEVTLTAQAYARTEVDTAVAPLNAKITEQEAALVDLRAQLIECQQSDTVTALLGGSYGAADESKYIDPQVARIFFTGNLTSDIPANGYFKQAYADGVRTFVISWKGTQTGAQIALALKSLPADVTAYGCFWHEPEDNIGKEITLAQWRARSIEHNAAMASVGVIPSCILMQYTLAPNSGRNPMDYANVGQRLQGWDYYMNPAKGKDDPEGAVDRMMTMSVQMGAEYVGIAETGCPSSVARATAVDLVKRLRAKVVGTPGMVWGTYWSSGDFVFTDATAKAWFLG